MIATKQHHKIWKKNKVKLFFNHCSFIALQFLICFYNSNICSYKHCILSKSLLSMAITHSLKFIFNTFRPICERLLTFIIYEGRLQQNPHLAKPTSSKPIIRETNTFDHLTTCPTWKIEWSFICNMLSIHHTIRSPSCDLHLY